MTRYREPQAHKPESRLSQVVEAIAFVLVIVGLVLIVGLVNVR